MATYTPGTEAAEWVNEVWAREIDVAAYHKAIIYPKFMERDPLHGQLHIPKHANVSHQDIGNTTSLSGLTYNINTESEATISPGTVVVPLQVNLNVIARMMKDPSDMLRSSIESSLAQGIDQDAGGLASSALVTNIVGDGAQNLDLSLILEAKMKGVQSGKEYWRPDTEGVYCCVGDTQVDHLLSIDNITSAQVRGDSENPTVKGWVAKAFGVYFYATGNLPTSGGVLYNLMFIPRAFGISWNQRVTVKMQDFDLVKKIIGWADFGVGAVREEYAVQLKTTSS